MCDISLPGVITLLVAVADLWQNREGVVHVEISCTKSYKITPCISYTVYQNLTEIDQCGWPIESA